MRSSRTWPSEIRLVRNAERGPSRTVRQSPKTLGSADPASGGGYGAAAPPIDPVASYRRAIRSAKRLARIHLRPPPAVTVSEWADGFRRLSSEASAEPGRWRTATAPYQREIMDSTVDPEVPEVVVMSSSQVGKTEILLNVVGYLIDLDPGPILVVQPTLEMSEAWSKDRLAPMLRDSPSLREKIPPAKSRSSGNTIRHKTFPGGHITMAGANSPAALASRPIRASLQDEIDRFPKSAGTEGAPSELADRRTNTFWNRIKLKVSTPTLKGFSHIDELYEASDQRQYHVPCPHCGHMQVLRWANVRWTEGDPETAVMVCSDDSDGEERGCGAIMEEGDKPGMLAGGAWVPRYATRKVRGYHINALYSPWRRWAEVVENFLRCKGSKEMLQTWVNTELGEPFEEDGERIEASALISRKERYAAEVPIGAGLLTAGIDVQGDRLESLIVGWGVDEEHWLIRHDMLFGDPGQALVWEELDALLRSEFRHESGAGLKVSAALVDHGGHHGEHVMRFVTGKARRRIFACRGMDGEGRPLVSRPKRSRRSRQGKAVLVGTVPAKDLIFTRLKIRDPGPGFMHIPDTMEDEVIFQITNEKVITRWSHGRPRRAYGKIRPGVAVEGLDCLVYNYGALATVGRAAHRRLEKWVAAVAERAAKASEASDEPPLPELPAPSDPVPVPKKRRKSRRRGRGWVKNW